MPNHVTNKLIFAAASAERVFAAVCPSGQFDFETLVPCPLHVYRGDLSADDDKDFPLNWHSWNKTHWGTKWNAYGSSKGIESEHAYITFDTAWSVPYPVIAAFANRFQIAFEHRYFDEGRNFWGVETWGTSMHGESGNTRLTKRFKDDADMVSLCKELKGYDPTDEVAT